MPKTYVEPQPFCNEARPSIALQPVESSQVEAIGYSDDLKTLAVTFKSRTPVPPEKKAIYHYPNVERATADAFVNAESIGAFFGQHIKALPFKKYRADAEAVPA